MAWRHRAREWVRRYAAAEVVGTLAAVAGAWLMRALTANDVLAAYGGTFGENLGYYGVIIARELASCARESGIPRWSLANIVRGCRNVALEFGGAEVLDSGLVRPLAMGIGSHYLGHGWGVLAGKVVADVLFYVPVIAAYELRRYHERSRSRATTPRTSDPA